MLFFCAGIALAGGGLDPTGKEERGATFESVVDLESIAPSDEGVIQIDIPGIGSRDFLSRFVGDTLFLPYMTFCDFLRIPINVSPDYLELSGQMPLGQPFEISRLSSTARSGRTDVFVPPTAIRVARGEVYVEQSFLLKVLNLQATYDTMELKLRLVPDEKIPALQWKKSADKYAALAYEEEPGMAPPEADVERHFLGNPVIDWNLNHQAARSSQATNANFRVGTELLFGTLELNSSFNAMNFKKESFQGRLNNWAWRYFMPTFSPIRQIGVGHMAIGSRDYYTAEVSNVPLTPRSGFAIHDIRGQTQAGWTVELYDGARLVDVTTADSAGRYDFRVPVGYGTVDRTLRFVGPYGESMTEQRRIQLNPQMVPEGEIEYSTRVGIEKFDPTAPVAAEGRLTLGISSTLSIGVEGMMATSSIKSFSKDSVDPAAFANLWFGDAGSMTVSANPIKGFGKLDYYTIASEGWSGRVELDSVAFNGSRFIAQAIAAVPVGSWTPSVIVRMAKDDFGYAPEITPGISMALWGVNLIGTVRTQFPYLRTATSLIDPQRERKLTAYTNLRAIFPTSMGAIFNLDLDYDWNARRMPRLDLSVYHRVLPGLGVNLSYSLADITKVTWHSISNGQLRLQFDVDLKQSKAIISGGQQGGEFSGYLMAQGSAMISPMGVVTTPTYALGQSAILVKPFHDTNQNGVRDANEDYLDPITCTISQGRNSMVSPDGSFTGLVANSQWVLEVDRWTFADQGIFPTKTRFSVFTTPSSLQVIEVACVEGFDVLGTCKVEEGTTASGKKMDFGGLLNGLRVQLVSSTNGAVFDGEVFSDGSIFIPGVCAGEYRVVLDQNQLASRRLAMLSTSDQITLNSENHRMPTILLQRVAR